VLATTTEKAMTTLSQKRDCLVKWKNCHNSLAKKTRKKSVIIAYTSHLVASKFIKEKLPSVGALNSHEPNNRLMGVVMKSSKIIWKKNIKYPAVDKMTKCQIVLLLEWGQHSLENLHEGHRNA